MYLKLKHPFQILAFLMAVLTFSMPFVTLAQQDLRAEAMIAAESDTLNDINSGMWFIGGCVFGLAGLGFAYIYEPTVPASRLLGKSPEYIAFYTDAYKAKSKKIQTNKAMQGCAVNGLAWAAYVVIVVVALADDASDDFDDLYW